MAMTWAQPGSLYRALRRSTGGLFSRPAGDVTGGGGGHKGDAPIGGSRPLAGQAVPVLSHSASPSPVSRAIGVTTLPRVIQALHASPHPAPSNAVIVSSEAEHMPHVAQSWRGFGLF